jgi:hypothetical protein
MLLRISFHSLLICLRYGLEAEVKCSADGLVWYAGIHQSKWMRVLPGPVSDVR